MNAEAGRYSGEMITIPVICTSHLTREVVDKLEELGDKNEWVKCAEYEDGFFIYAMQEYDEETTPKCLADIFEWAKENGFYWIRLDSAYEAVDELPTYAW